MKKNGRHIYSICKLLVITTILFFVVSFQQSSSNADTFANLKKLRIKVLKENSIGKEFEYDLSEQKGCNKTKLTYLGIVTTKTNKKYKLLNSFWVTGKSCRGVSRLVIYDTNNVYLGNYYFDMIYGLPDQLVNNEIIYKNSSENCNDRQGTKISFKNGLPKSFYVCQDRYYFQRDE